MGAGPDFRARLAPYPCGVTSFQPGSDAHQPLPSRDGHARRLFTHPPQQRSDPPGTGSTRRPVPPTTSENTLTPQSVRISSMVLRRLAARISHSALASRREVGTGLIRRAANQGAESRTAQKAGGEPQPPFTRRWEP